MTHKMRLINLKCHCHMKCLNKCHKKTGSKTRLMTHRRRTCHNNIKLKKKKLIDPKNLCSRRPAPMWSMSSRNS
jgi:hypothetical protein